MKFGVFYEHQYPRPWEPGGEARLFHEAIAERIPERTVRREERTAEGIAVQVRSHAVIGVRAPPRLLPGLHLALLAVGVGLRRVGIRLHPLHRRACGGEK